MSEPTNDNGMSNLIKLQSTDRHVPNLADMPGLRVAPVLRSAFSSTSEIDAASDDHLPQAERFRACGALRDWLAVFDALPSLAGARRSIADPNIVPRSARYELMMALEPYIEIGAAENMQLVPKVQALLTVACDTLTYWLRGNALEIDKKMAVGASTRF